MVMCNILQMALKKNVNNFAKQLIELTVSISSGVIINTRGLFHKTSLPKKPGLFMLV